LFLVFTRCIYIINNKDDYTLCSTPTPPPPLLMHESWRKKKWKKRLLKSVGSPTSTYLFFLKKKTQQDDSSSNKKDLLSSHERSRMSTLTHETHAPITFFILFLFFTPNSFVSLYSNNKFKHIFIWFLIFFITVLILSWISFNKWLIIAH